MYTRATKQQDQPCLRYNSRSWWSDLHSDGVIAKEGVPIKNRSKREFQRAYEVVYDMLIKKGYKPQLHKLDNETARDLMEWIKEQQTAIQFTPPEIHQTNAA
eukprot:13510599-Ditylum_brightwellii.AAC.1